MNYNTVRAIKAFSLAGVLTLALIIIIFASKPDLYSGQVSPDIPRESYITPNTVRIYGQDPFETAVAISRSAYPATFEDNKPNAVILVRPDREEEALLAAAVIHHPIDAPILYTERDKLPSVTADEIKRLDPQGIQQDGRVQVIAIGELEDSLMKQLKEMGLKTRLIKSSDPADLSLKIDTYISAIHGDHRDAVAVASLYFTEYALPAAFWNAHMGDGLAYVWGDTLPSPTKQMLKSRFGGAYIYLMGPEDVISRNLAEELATLGHVQRIPGDTPAGLSAAYAGFKDTGKNQGWWVGKTSRDYGWGISEGGHNFIFVNPGEWQYALPAAVLSHKGKHGPVLYVYRDFIPQETENFLNSVRPGLTSTSQQLVNHGWIIGGPDIISPETQYRLDSLLSAE